MTLNEPLMETKGLRPEPRGRGGIWISKVGFGLIYLDSIRLFQLYARSGDLAYKLGDGRPAGPVPSPGGAPPAGGGV